MNSWELSQCKDLTSQYFILYKIYWQFITIRLKASIIRKTLVCCDRVQWGLWCSHVWSDKLVDMESNCSSCDHTLTSSVIMQTTACWHVLAMVSSIIMTVMNYSLSHFKESLGLALMVLTLPQLLLSRPTFKLILNSKVHLSISRSTMSFSACNILKVCQPCQPSPT